MSKPVSILDAAIKMGANQDEHGSINGSEFNRLGLPIMGGCLHCEATVGAYNAYPSKTGYLMCADCVGDQGFSTVEEFQAFTKE